MTVPGVCDEGRARRDLVLSAEALSAWGWRIPFMLGLLIAPLGIYIPSRLRETLSAEHAVKSNRELLRGIVDAHCPNWCSC
jgi:hypothetical protein